MFLWHNLLILMAWCTNKVCRHILLLPVYPKPALAVRNMCTFSHIAAKSMSGKINPGTHYTPCRSRFIREYFTKLPSKQENFVTEAAPGVLQVRFTCGLWFRVKPALIFQPPGTRNSRCTKAEVNTGCNGCHTLAILRTDPEFKNRRDRM